MQTCKPTDPLSVDKAWEQWLKRIERYLRYFRINNPVDRTDALLIFGGREIAYPEKCLPDPVDKLDENQKIRKKLTEYYLPRRNKHFARFLFLKMRPTPEEITI